MRFPKGSKKQASGVVFLNSPVFFLHQRWEVRLRGAGVRCEVLGLRRDGGALTSGEMWVIYRTSNLIKKARKGTSLVVQCGETDRKSVV